MGSYMKDIIRPRGDMATGESHAALHYVYY